MARKRKKKWQFKGNKKDLTAAFVIMAFLIPAMLRGSKFLPRREKEDNKV